MEKAKPVSAPQISELDEEMYLNYEEGVCEAPQEVSTPTAHLDFDNNICTAEPLNYCAQPGEDDQFIFEPQTKEIAKKEDKKELEKSVERFASEPKKSAKMEVQSITASVSAANISPQIILLGAAGLVSSAPLPFSLPLSAADIPLRGAYEYVFIDFSGDLESGKRSSPKTATLERVADREPPENLPVLEIPTDAGKEMSSSSSSDESASASSTHLSSSIPATSPKSETGESVSNTLLENPVYRALSLALWDQERWKFFEGTGSFILRSMQEYFNAGLLEGVDAKVRSGTIAPLPNMAVSLGQFFIPERLEYGDVGLQLMTVLHPAMLPMENTRNPIFNLARNTMNSETERVVASADPQSSDNRNHHSNAHSGKEGEEPSYADELVEIQELV